MPFRFLLPVLLLSISLIACAGEDGFTPLFNGKDLTGWDGDPKLWKVEDGIVTGTCAGPDALANNSFLIWRGGTVKDFELRATVRVVGDNNSGIQYRSREAPEVAPWVITGYQCDIHPALVHTGMTYEERGRGIFGLNGTNVLLDPEGALWELSMHEPVKVDVSQWNEYTIIARGNHLIHQINGRTTSELTDCDEKKRAMEGLLAIQLHRGNANTVQIKDLRLKVLTDGAVIPFNAAKLPAGAKKIEKPRTSNPQGTGPVVTTPATDSAWLQQKGTLIFHDAFEREEDGNLAGAIGNGWNSATANRVPKIKQADLDEGILKVSSATVEARHAAHIHHEAGFKDGGVVVRFRFPGLNPKESLQLGFVDRELKGVHAGHLCYGILNTVPGSITLIDHKTGIMNLQNQKRRNEALAKKEKIPADLQTLLAAKKIVVPWQPDHEWHELVLVTAGDEMRLSLDGKVMARHRSEGFAHPVKRWFSFLINATVWIDDVKIWRVQ